MEFLNNVEDPEALPQAEMRRLAEISIYLDEFLRLLNSPKHELPDILKFITLTDNVLILHSRKTMRKHQFPSLCPAE